MAIHRNGAGWSKLIRFDVMTHVGLRLLATTVILGVSALAAQAADMSSPSIIPAPFDGGPVGPSEGGWYLRGDIGVGIQTPDSIGYAPALDGYKLQGSTYESPAIIGAGIGYQLNPWFRADLTAQYRSNSGFGYTFHSADADPDTAGDQWGANSFSGRMSSVVVMANAYADLGSYAGLTPFVGAGLGYGWHTTNGFSDVGSGFHAGGYGSASSRTDGNFAWALHAGLGYTVSSNLKLELGYTYSNFGDVNQGTIACAGAPCTAPKFKNKNLDSHDLHLGMRWMLQPETPIAVAPEPFTVKN